jgi:hypothetical protein
MKYVKPVSRSWIELKEPWHRFCDELDKFLWHGSKTQSISEWQEDLRSWSEADLDIAQNKKGKFREEITICHALLWCAHTLQEHQHQTFLDLPDMPQLTTAEVPPFIYERPHWIRDALLCMAQKDTVARTLIVHVAIIENNQQPTIAELHQELLLTGSGKHFHHPKDALRTFAHTSFAASLTQAWDTNLQSFLLETNEGSEVKWNGRWRLLDKIGNPVIEVSGRSASAAAAWGWWFLLRDKIPDAGIIVMAQVDESGRFAGVNGIIDKTEAVMKDGRFDTIIVASKENEEEAKRVLQTSSRVRVVRISD